MSIFRGAEVCGDKMVYAAQYLAVRHPRLLLTTRIGVSVVTAIALNQVVDQALGGLSHMTVLASGPPTATPIPNAMETVQKHLSNAILTPGIPGASATVNAAGREIATLQHLAISTPIATATSVLASTPAVGPEAGPDLLGGVGGLAKQFLDWTFLSDYPWYLKLSAWVPIAATGTIVGIAVHGWLQPNRPQADTKEEMPIQAFTRRSEESRAREAAETKKRIVSRVSEDDPSVFRFILNKCNLRKGEIDMAAIPDNVYSMCFTEFYHPNEFLFKYTPWSQQITDEVKQALEPINDRLDRLSDEQLAQSKTLTKHEKAILTMARAQLEEMARRYGNDS